MNSTNYFRISDRAESFGTIIFWIVLATSAVLTAFAKPEVEAVGHPFLIILAILAIICTMVTKYSQTEGNRALRLTQLSNALGAGVGQSIRSDYYNNVLPQSVLRLAATTLENTHFTKEILGKMAVKERIKNGTYFILLIIFLAWRATPSSWLLLISQTLFSADLILNWIYLERFRIRVNRVYGQLEQFFLQRGDTARADDMAILLGAFTDYECAKDEAAMPLDTKIFNNLNATLSKEWEEIQTRLKIK